MHKINMNYERRGLDFFPIVSLLNSCPIISFPSCYIDTGSGAQMGQEGGKQHHGVFTVRTKVYAKLFTFSQEENFRTFARAL